MEVNIFKENFMIFSHSYSCTITLNYIRQVKLFNEAALLSVILFSLVVIEMWDQIIQTSMWEPELKVHAVTGCQLHPSPKVTYKHQCASCITNIHKSLVLTIDV